jgi:glutathione S-transferase
MQLIGMLDSPYVLRVAISLKLMGVPFDHQAGSVFRHFDRFQNINPLVKAPTLVCDDGVILMDSTLILDYVESLAPVEKRLMPASGVARRDVLHNIGVALVACEKAVQRYYETSLRPAEKQHEPWLARVTAQMNDALSMMENIVADTSPHKQWLRGATMMQDDLTIAIAWRFTDFVMPGSADATRFPKLAAFSQRAEALPVFISTPLH